MNDMSPEALRRALDEFEIIFQAAMGLNHLQGNHEIASMQSKHLAAIKQLRARNEVLEVNEAMTVTACDHIYRPMEVSPGHKVGVCIKCGGRACAIAKPYWKCAMHWPTSGVRAWGLPLI